MLVSICMVTYNNEATIKKCMESILQQSYGDIELIIRDVCSKDKTVDIMIEMQKRFRENGIYCQVQTSKDSLKLTNALKLCYQEAEGEISFVLDPDVCLDKECVNNAVDVFDKNKDVGAVVMGNQKNTVVRGLDIIKNFEHYMNIKSSRIFFRYIARKKALSQNVDFQYNSHLFIMFQAMFDYDAGFISENNVTEMCDENNTYPDDVIGYIFEKYLLFMNIYNNAVSRKVCGIDETYKRTQNALYRMCDKLSKEALKLDDKENAFKCNCIKDVFKDKF